MNLLSWITGIFLATNTIISPLADTQSVISPPVQPAVSFSAYFSYVPTPTSSPSPVPNDIKTKSSSTTPTPISKHLKKTHYTIALIGDSMIDTLGKDLPHLQKHLSYLYPNIRFTLLNYGVGGTNIDYGIQRLTSPYTYLGLPYPALISQTPDIIVVESFGYNPYTFSDGAIDTHWLALATMVDTIRSRLPATKVMIASTIAPNPYVFGDGAPNIAFNTIEKMTRTDTIKRYLENALRFAQSQNLPYANAYHASLDSAGNGRLVYINNGDHIHYSDAGRELFSGKIADAIARYRLLE